MIYDARNLLTPHHFTWLVEILPNILITMWRTYWFTDPHIIHQFDWQSEIVIINLMIYETFWSHTSLRDEPESLSTMREVSSPIPSTLVFVWRYEINWSLHFDDDLRNLILFTVHIHYFTRRSEVATTTLFLCLTIMWEFCLPQKRF